MIIAASSCDGSIRNVIYLWDYRHRVIKVREWIRKSINGSFPPSNICFIFLHTQSPLEWTFLPRKRTHFHVNNTFWYSILCWLWTCFERTFFWDSFLYQSGNQLAFMNVSRVNFMGGNMLWCGDFMTSFRGCLGAIQKLRYTNFLMIFTPPTPLNPHYTPLPSSLCPSPFPQPPLYHLLSSLYPLLPRRMNKFAICYEFFPCLKILKSWNFITPLPLPSPFFPYTPSSPFTTSPTSRR